ncbi:MAG: autotransporter outer membrane beta-barrel domain-containing protein, partial [Betaproteobacteria bacterium]|nr:autotransporter outer membrane beta-barrel domain-containing protein [Betaproteobacteria bacterium]
WAILPLGAAGPTVDPNTESLSKGFLTGMSLLNQSGDLIAGWGTNAAMGAAIQAERDGAEFGVFAAVSGGKSRYETGSHVDLSGFSLMAGFSGRSQLQPGNLLIGLFFEHGNGTYDVYTSVHGRGDLTYLGMGLIGRMDFTDTDSGHFYAEASARAGNMWNNYNRSGLYDGWGREATYKVSSGYHGLHAGTGYIWKLADKTSLDLYSKVFWTQQEGDSTRLSTGERLDFDNVTSKRLRAGGRLSHAVRPNTNVYVGAAHEHEFGGKASATTSGLAIGVPTLRGRTNIGELGLTLKPSKDRPLLLDVSVQGYTGKREGVAGILHVRYDF